LDRKRVSIWPIPAKLRLRALDRGQCARQVVVPLPHSAGRQSLACPSCQLPVEMPMGGWAGGQVICRRWASSWQARPEFGRQRMPEVRMGLPVGFESRLLSGNVQGKPKPKLHGHLEHAKSPQPACWLKPACPRVRPVVCMIEGARAGEQPSPLVLCGSVFEGRRWTSSIPVRNGDGGDNMLHLG
jgi:hypothetical protein